MKNIHFIGFILWLIFSFFCFKLFTILYNWFDTGGMVFKIVVVLITVFIILLGFYKILLSFLLKDVYPPNYLNPLEYTKENLSEIMDKILIFDIGNQNSDDIQESLVGAMTNCTLASNPPHLLGTARVTLLDGSEKGLDFFQIKQIRRQ